MNDHRVICQKISNGFNPNHRSCHSGQQRANEGCWVLFYLIMNEETWKNLCQFFRSCKRALRHIHWCEFLVFSPLQLCGTFIMHSGESFSQAME